MRIDIRMAAPQGRDRGDREPQRTARSSRAHVDRISAFPRCARSGRGWLSWERRPVAYNSSSESPTSPSPARASRSAAMARAARDLTVPSETPSRAEISG